MPIAQRLLSTHRALATLSRGICQYDLADAAREADLRGGRILRPRFNEDANHLPYAAARPLAEHVRGARQITLEGAALRGASMAVSFVRSDVPAAAGFAAAFWAPKGFFRGAMGAPGRGPAAGLVGTVAPAAVSSSLRSPLGLAPWALGCWETVLGSGTRQEFRARAVDKEERGLPAIPGAEQVRRVGLVGLVESGLIGLAGRVHDRGRTGLEAAVLSVAVGLRLAVLPLRAASTILVASVALVGAALGVLYSAAADLAFVLRRAVASRRFDEPEVISLREAQQRQEVAFARRHFPLYHDTATLPLPAALWFHRFIPHQQFFNAWTQVAVCISAWLCVQPYLEDGLREGAELVAEHGPDVASLLFGWDACALLLNVVAAALTYDANPWDLFGNRNEPLPPLPRDGEAAAQGAPGPHQRPLARLGPRRRAPADRALANEHRRGVDVHERGRDPAMRESLCRLLRRHPTVPVEPRIRELLAAIAECERRRSPLSQRAHSVPEAGSVLQAAQRVLGVGPASRREREVGMLSNPPARDIQLEPGVHVPLKTTLATTWHAIDQLHDPRGAAFDADLRGERRDALFVALSDCMDDFGMLVCTPGQAQRMLLVLQGFVEGVQIDPLAAAPTVAEFVTGAYRHIVRDLPDDAPPGDVRARFHAAYADGVQALPTDQLARLRNELAALLHMDHELAWDA